MSRIRWQKLGECIAGGFMAFTAGALAADGAIHAMFPTHTELIEYRREVGPGETVWDICADIATDKEDLRKLVYQTLQDNNIKDPAQVQPGMLLIVRVKQAREAGNETI